MKLYHATYSKLLKKIQKQGYLGNSPYKLWSDSDNRYVYLASDPDEAYSYAETALDEIDNEKLYDMLEDDEIVVLETDTKYLDKNKLFKDKNVIDGETTYQYEGIINCQCLRIFDMNKYNNEIEECLRIAGVKLTEREDLTKFNRIAGFYHLDTKQFELFPRTSEEISTEDDEINDYIHNVHSKDEFTEFHIVRFGIEDIPGEGVVCYIEADTKRHAEECYYAILEKYAEECDIIKYELEYYVGNKPKYIFLNRYGDEELNESIAYVSKKDLSDIILKNPTRKEILEYDNPVLKHQDWRIAKDNNGNYYFGSGYDWIHFEMCNTLKKQGIDIDVVFSDYDGVASYDSKTNTFYIRDEYGEPEIIEQEFNNSYIKNAFPNAKLEIDAEYDELDESIIHAEKSNYDDYMAVVLKNPTKRELRENGLDRSRFICFEDGTWLFFDSMQWIHENMLDQFSPNFGKGKAGGFYDLTNNEFIFIEPMDYDEGEEGYEEEFNYYIDKEQKFLLSYPYIVNTFGKNFNIMVYGDWVDNPW